MESITTGDLKLINNLSARKYSANKLLSNAALEEKNRLEISIAKLKTLADYFAQKYNQIYGPFETSVTTGNPIAIGGTNLKRVWAGIFKGARNKQYAAQISFVMNPQEVCLDVGFYFGRASGHSFNKDQRKELETQLNNLGIFLSDSINNDSQLKKRYNALFDFGFIAYSGGNSVLPDDWYKIIRTKTKNSQIIAKIYPNDFGVIENSTIDSFVSQIIFLMGAIKDSTINQGLIIIKPLTPEQRAKQAERLAQIGQKGELFVMEFEQERLAKLGISVSGYPKHVALDSMHYGYDILSLDENKNEIFIEVKTTTRIKEDENSRIFFISANEFLVFSNNKQKYKLYRVYDIENLPNVESLDLDVLTKNADGYIVKY